MSIVQAELGIIANDNDESGTRLVKKPARFQIVTGDRSQLPKQK